MSHSTQHTETYTSVDQTNTVKALKEGG